MRLPLRRYLGLGALATCTVALLVACGGNGTSLPAPSVAELAVTTDEATAVALGVAVPGVVDYGGDSDAFVFDVEEGVFYEVNVRLGTLEFPMVDVMNSDGGWLAGNVYYDELDSRVVWEAESSGRNFVVVSSDDMGSYELLVSEFVDDHGDLIGEATVVALGVPVSGVVDYPGDWNRDWDLFVFEVEEDVAYEIDLSLGTLSNPIVDVLDRDGGWLERVYNVTSLFHSTSLPSRVWQAESSGRHFVQVSGYDAGSYELLVSEFMDDDHGDSIGEATVVALGVPVSGALDYLGGWDGDVSAPNGDQDFFVFEVEKGVFYEIDVGSGTLSKPIVDVLDKDGVLLGRFYDGSPFYDRASLPSPVWRAESSGRYFVQISGYGTGSYELLVSEIVDDHGDWVGEATVVTLGVPVSGVVEYGHDYDVFVFEAEEGMFYEIDVDLGTLEFLMMRVYDSGGGWPVEDYVFGESSTSRVVWEAESSGQHFIGISGFGGMTAGSYELVVDIRYCGVLTYCG